jgi:putative phosphoesterase
MADHNTTIVGIVSDTHGTLHPRVLDVLREARVERILHAGDMGDYSVLSALSTVAPVLAVRGNVDRSGPVRDLPVELRLDIAGVDVYMTHIGAVPRVWLARLPVPRPDVAVCGHSHKALIERVSGVLFVNPGAAGTGRRFGRPQTLAILRIQDGRAEADIMELGQDFAEGSN